MTGHPSDFSQIAEIADMKRRTATRCGGQVRGLRDNNVAVESPTSLDRWEMKVLAVPGAEQRVREIEDELLLAVRAGPLGPGRTSTSSVNEPPEGDR